jgi:pimeloyl-ACP methyl ester carboxylesterase
MSSVWAAAHVKAGFLMTTPGTVLHSESVATSIANAQAWRVRYASSDESGRAQESTGLVIAPTRADADRPVLTWCHGTTGLGDASCPSAQPDPVRELTTYFTENASAQIDYGVPGLQAMVDAGWIVCATDYQGLGTPGMHQYMVSRTQARDALNIVHAARSMGIGAGTKVGALGWSQGGGTAAALAELDAADFGDLTLIGTVPMSPGVTSIAISHPAGPAAALTDPTVAPDSHLIMMLAGCAAGFPLLDLSDVLSPLGIRIVDNAWNIQPVHHLNDTLARLFHLEGQILQVNKDAMPAWLDAFTQGSAARVKPACPVLMCQDSFSGGTVVPVVWQQAYADAVTQLGGSVTVRDYPKDDHFSLPQSCIGDALTWLNSLL